MLQEISLIYRPIVSQSPEPTGGYIEPLIRSRGRWIEASEVDAEARRLFLRHEAWRGNGRPTVRKVGGPGSQEKLVLVTPQADAIMVMRRVSHPYPVLNGVEVVCFRNEGYFRSCSMIREAMVEWASVKWPGVRLFVCVPGRRVVASNPGYPFRLAGWRRCGLDERGLILLDY